MSEGLQLYALEGFLDRLANSALASTLVLKGGVLLSAFDARRPTRDIDIAALDLANDVANVHEVVRSIAQRSPSRPDGLEFSPDTITCTTIREDDVYSGVRARLESTLATARITFHVDVNVGDPIWPPPTHVALPRILGGSPIQLLGYPIVMVIAEKAITALQRGRANTRFRDFADIWTLAGRYEFDSQDLRAAVTAVVDHRDVTVMSLRDVLTEYSAAMQNQWTAWRARWARDDLPLAFDDVVTGAINLIDPILDGTFAMTTWQPTSRTWSRRN